MNKCIIKYIHLKDLRTEHLHTLQDYEYCKASITHCNYEELEAKVQAACPVGFTCVDPIALHHELLWESSLKSTGSVIERDNLFHVVDASDYQDIHWNIPNTPPVSVCVEIEKEQRNTNGIALG